MALRGVSFISRFYRKDLIIEIIYRKSGVNVFIFILIVLSLSLIESYSVRFFIIYFLIIG